MADVARRDHRSRPAKLRRRLITIPSLFAGAIALTLTVPIWFPAAVLVDGIRLRRRMPLARLGTFGLCWSWLEIAGVLRATVLWLRGRGTDEDAHYALMGWWAGALMHALSTTTGIRPTIEGAEALRGGNAVVMARHASLADSLLSAWVIRTVTGLSPRYVLKRELLLDPCLDIVGLRVPNHFLDRETDDPTEELAALGHLAAGIGPGVVGVIFPEGTRANDRKRSRAIQRIAERDPDRAARMAGLRHLLPPRPAGSVALLEGAPTADVVLAWHTGFDGLDSFSGIVAELASPLPSVRFVVRRVRREDVAGGDEFAAWLDEAWLRMDDEVDAALTP